MKSPIFWVKRLGQQTLFLKVGSLPMTHWAAKKEQLLTQVKDWPESTAEDKICWKRSPFAPDCHQPGLHHCLHPYPRHHPHHNHHLVDRSTIPMGKLPMPCFAPAALSSERQEFWCRCRHWFGFSRCWPETRRFAVCWTKWKNQFGYATLKEQCAPWLPDWTFSHMIKNVIQPVLGVPGQKLVQGNSQSVLSISRCYIHYLVVIRKALCSIRIFRNI